MAPPSGNASRPGRGLALLAAIIVVLILGIVGADIASPASWHKDFKVHLGLDLTSGTTVALQAQAPKGHQVTQADMAQAVTIMDNRVNGAGISEASVAQQGSNIINIAVPGAGAAAVIKEVAQTAELQFRQVLLVAPNSAAATTPTPAPSASAAPSPNASSSPSASPSATGTPKAAGLPGTGSGVTQQMSAGARALSASGSASASSSSSASPSASASASPTPSPTSGTSKSGTSTWQQASGDPTLVSASTKALFNKLNCTDKNWKSGVGYNNQQWNTAGDQIVSCGQINGIWYKYALDKAKVTGKMISSASATPSSTSTDWQVNLNFNSAGSSAFGALTTAMYSKYQGSNTLAQNQVAVVLDGVVQSAPFINSAIVNGQAQITGSYTQSQATNLANILSYGALPLSFTVQSVQSISPQLGSAQLTAGLIAAGIGLALVVLYLIVYYRGLAVVAVSSLVIAAALAYLLVVLLGKYAGLALSLAGIAGLIVAIGITADSFIVYFERLRDEVREGKSLRSAVERGWVRARRTILVSDTVSFLAAALLYYFAIGQVRGFAFTLGLTTIIDVLVVFTFTKPTMTLLARTKFYGGGHRWSGLDPARLGAKAPWRGARRTSPASARTTSVKEA